MRIGVKIALAFFLVAFLSMMVIGIISYLRARHSLEQQCFDKLTAVREMKSEQIQDYFQIIKDQITTAAEDAMIVNAMKDLKKGYNTVCGDLKLKPADIGFLREKVENYFEDEYITRLNSNLTLKASLATEISYKKESIVLQHLYYESNPNKVGEKLKMEQAGDSSFYSRSHARYHPVLRDFLEKFGYYDIFLIDNATGNIVYTVYKETDFATSLMDGPFKNTNLAIAFKAAAASDSHDFVKLVDFEAYHPSYNQSASFIACPVFDGDKKIGVLAYQMPIDKIDDIMTSKKQWSEVGLGKTGETYIVGSDYTLRNQSRFLIEDSSNYFKMLESIHVDPKTIHKIRSFGNSVGLQEVRTEGTEAALKGASDTRIFPAYRGVPVLSAFKPLHIMDMHWVLMSEIDEAEAFEQITRLRNNIIVGFLCLLIVVFAVSYYVSRELTRPLKELTIDAEELSKGNLDVNILTGRKDEIGILANSFKSMQASISKLISDLRHINHNLEEKVVERTAEVVRQKDIIEEKQKEVLESIHYARRIQNTLLAHDQFLQKNLPEFFVLFRPKDIVSGDFYWATRKVRTAAPVAAGREGRDQKPTAESEKTELFYVAVCDSTGHGVPGAFMSLLNISFLNEAINEKDIDQPHEILNHVRKRLIRNISQDGAQDGMDGIVVCFDKIRQTISYAAAHNAPVIVRNGQLTELSADKMPVGQGIRTDSFTLHYPELQKNDMLYLYTDGYADQFGGPNGKKFKYKTLNNLLAELSEKPLAEQKQALGRIFDEWKARLEQVDDVCIMGIRI